MDAHYKLDKFNAAHDAIREGVLATLKAAAFAIQDEAMENIQEEKLIDTGTLRRSVYVVCDGTDERLAKLSDALSAAETTGAKSGKPNLTATAAAPGPAIDVNFQAKVGVCVHYGLYLEMGTVYISPKPFLRPAAEKVKKQVQKMANAYVAEALASALA